MPSLLFPKYVVVKNTGLVALHNTLLILMASFLVSRFIMASQWAEFIPIGQYVHPVLSVSGPVDEVYKASRQAMASPACAAGATDYWWDPEGEFAYLDYACNPACGTEVAGESCTPSAWNSIVESSDSVFLPTSMREEADGAGKHQNSFILGSEALTVALDYTVKIPPFNWLMARITGETDSYFEGKSTTNILTVVMKSNGEVDHYHFPEEGKHVSLSIPKLFELSGAVGSLDDFLPEMGVNMLSNAAHPEGPNVRISGVELALLLNCHQRPTHHAPGNWSQHTCYLTVDPVWSWSRRDLIFGARGAPARVIFHGIRVRSSAAGTFEFLSFERCFYNVVSAIVLMKLPMTFVYFFAVHCLGGLSCIYTKVVQETFSLSEEIAGTLTRLMMSSLAFIRLRDRERGISKDQFALACIATLKRGNLIPDPQAVREIVDISFEALHCKRENKIKSGSYLQQTLRRVKGWFVEPREDGDGANVMDVDGFLEVSGNLDHVRFDDVVHLFDQKRNVGFLERFFTPKSLRLHQKLATPERSSGDEYPEIQHILSRLPGDSNTTALWSVVHEKSYVPAKDFGGSSRKLRLARSGLSGQYHDRSHTTVSQPDDMQFTFGDMSAHSMWCKRTTKMFDALICDDMIPVHHQMEQQQQPQQQRQPLTQFRTSPRTPRPHVPQSPISQHQQELQAQSRTPPRTPRISLRRHGKQRPRSQRRGTLAHPPTSARAATRRRLNGSYILWRWVRLEKQRIRGLKAIKRLELAAALTTYEYDTSISALRAELHHLAMQVQAMRFTSAPRR